jgi:hypothetical protein
MITYSKLGCLDFVAESLFNSGKHVFLDQQWKTCFNGNLTRWSCRTDSAKFVSTKSTCSSTRLYWCIYRFPGAAGTATFCTRETSWSWIRLSRRGRISWCCIHYVEQEKYNLCVMNFTKEQYSNLWRHDPLRKQYHKTIQAYRWWHWWQIGNIYRWSGWE